MRRQHFRFEDLEMWQDSRELASMSLTLEKMRLLGEEPASGILEMADKPARKLTSLINHLFKIAASRLPHL